MLGLNPWLLLSIAVVWLASAVGSGYLGYDYATAKCAQEKLSTQQMILEIRESNQKVSDDLGQRLEKKLANLRITNTTIQQEVRHEREVQTRVLDNPDCNLPDSTRRLLNRARGVEDAAPTPRQPPSGVPKDATLAGDDKVRGSR